MLKAVVTMAVAAAVEKVLEAMLEIETAKGLQAQRIHHTCGRTSTSLSTGHNVLP